MTGTEIPLNGGNMSTGVVRAGDTVRRPAGPWTPAVHALLTHLHEVSFRGAPRPLGIDDRGREILTFVPGTVVWPGHFHLLDADGQLVRAARLIRESRLPARRRRPSAAPDRGRLRAHRSAAS